MPNGTAAVFEKLFTPLSVADVRVDDPGPGEALEASRSGAVIKPVLRMPE